MSDKSGIEWTDVPTHDGYAVSVDGEIRGPSGRVLRPMAADTGHLYVLAPRPRDPRKLFIHRAVLFAFVGPPAEGQEVRHVDGNPSNNRLDNLRWGTRLEQREDDRRNGVSRRGPSVLTPEEARAIKRRLASNEGVRAIARGAGVSHSTVIGIRDGRLWRAA